MRKKVSGSRERITHARPAGRRSATPARGGRQAAFEAGNVALSIRYLGHISGVALAVTAASGVAAYNPDDLVIALLTWVGVTIVFAVLVSVLAIFARTVILAGVDVVDEVDNQKNVGVAAVEAAIYLSIGLFFTALFA